ncbi:aspartyl protease family protein [Sphingomonas endophytica]|uniref:Aspartyl protease family protein n=1 Tax=Sphingomonas endophytica TaxID=869719 RepID=A0A7X0JAT0_9SPHN|nr:TIGR02281 family clan AA aspartic protease [Sphingomonas endophytica]MBB6504173.1 aspartyl protease family protein [Sphingomonas endophytica]
MPAWISANPHFYLLLGALFVAALVARRIPILRTLVSLALWIGAGLLLYATIAERGRFDPWLGRAAAALDLDEQKVAGEETRIRMSRDGHFYVRAKIGGVERRLLVDSGATITALSPATAAAAGVEVKPAVFPVLLKTANGTIRADTGEVPELRFGNVVARDLAVVVSPAFGDVDVLGMNFLSRLKSWRVEGRTLILTPHHPQDTKAELT